MWCCSIVDADLGDVLVRFERDGDELSISVRSFFGSVKRSTSSVLPYSYIIPITEQLAGDCLSMHKQMLYTRDLPESGKEKNWFKIVQTERYGQVVIESIMEEHSFKAVFCIDGEFFCAFGESEMVKEIEDGTFLGELQVEPDWF